MVPPWCLPGCPHGPFLPPWCLHGAYWSFPASLVPPWCLAGCPIDPFLPPWCLPGCPIGPFLPPWCLPGAFLPPWCLLGASQAVTCPRSPFLPPWCLSGCPDGRFLWFRPYALALADYWSHPVLPSHREARKAHTGKKHKGAREELNPGPLTSRDLKDPAGTTRLQGPLSGGRL